jgi:hypothetical protein
MLITPNDVECTLLTLHLRYPSVYLTNVPVNFEMPSQTLNLVATLVVGLSSAPVNQSPAQICGGWLGLGPLSRARDETK